MKRLLTAIAAAGLLLLPTVAFAQAASGEKSAPPISQALVREGDFALELAVKLRLGEPSTEAEAEDILTSAGVMPEKGWMADYPMTPDILAELEISVEKAAGSGKLRLAKDEAVKVFWDLAREQGLAVKPADVEYAEKPGELEYGDYSSEMVGDIDEYYEPEVIREYYYTEGPPVITYYTPPWDYYYLYSWVPYPFWWHGYWCHGYFILNDFNVVVNVRVKFKDKDTVVVSRADKVVSNHIRDSKTGKVERVRPARLAKEGSGNWGRTVKDGAGRDASRLDRKSAESIVERGNTKGWKRSADRDTVTARTPVKSGGKSWSRSSDSGATVGRTNARAGTDSVRRERSVDRPARLGDASRGRGWDDGSSYRATPRDSGRSFERATRIGDSSRGSGWNSGRSVRSTPGDSGRSFNSAPARSHGGGGGGINRGGGGGGFNRGGGGWGGGGGCRGKNC